MSQENVTLLRRVNQAFNERDLDAFLALVVDLGERHDRGHGAESNTPVEQRSWHVTQWRAGKVVRWQAYGTEAEALEAVEVWE